jgi:hypothetical protein
MWSGIGTLRETMGVKHAEKKFKFFLKFPAANADN